MVIGLMGGVGSGKSTVLNYLEKRYNAFIIQSDHVAKEIMKQGEKAYKDIAETFPDVIVDEKIDTGRLAKIVFSDNNKLKKLNAITHPAVIQKITEMISDCLSDVIVVESALMIGSGLEQLCDELWFVYCEKEERIQRLMNNRGYTREKAESIMKNQLQDFEYNKYADEYIDNSYSTEKTIEQIDLILRNQDCC